MRRPASADALVLHNAWESSSDPSARKHASVARPLLVCGIVKSAKLDHHRSLDHPSKLQRCLFIGDTSFSSPKLLAAANDASAADLTDGKLSAVATTDARCNVYFANIDTAALWSRAARDTKASEAAADRAGFCVISVLRGRPAMSPPRAAVHDYACAGCDLHCN